MSDNRFHPGQVQVFREGGYFVHHEALAENSKPKLSKAAPGSAVAPRTYTPRTAGGHDAVLARARDRHTRAVQQANVLTQQRDQLNAPAETGSPTEESQP